MIDPSDHIAEQIVKQRMAIIKDMLTDLASKFDFHFALNYALLAQAKRSYILNEGFMNKYAHALILESFIETLKVQYEIATAHMTAIGTGRIVVVCANDREQEGIYPEPVVAHTIYTVEHVHIIGAQRYYTIQGLNHGQTPGYDTQRFFILFNDYNRN